MAQSSRWVRIKGRLTRPVAKAAGDRRSEAHAELEARTGRDPDDRTVDAAERVIKRRYRDTGGRRDRRQSSPDEQRDRE
jgi:hypothetical protein